MSNASLKCGPNNNVTEPDFLSTWAYQPVAACFIWYGGNDTKTAIFQNCCGNEPIVTYNDGCLQYCNTSKGTGEFNLENCLNTTTTGVFGTCGNQGLRSGVPGAGRVSMDKRGLGVMFLVVAGLVVGL